MKQLFPVFLFCSIFCQFLMADEVSVPSINDPQQYRDQIKIISELATQQEQGDAYYHRIQNIDTEKKVLILDDQSKWDIGSWYEEVIVNWQIGDRISLFFDATQSGFGIHNLDRDSFAWGIWDFRISSSENSDSIVEVSYDDSPKYSIKITLKSGFQFGIPPQIISGIKFYMGDPVYIFFTGNKYMILNLSNDTMAFGSVLLKRGNPEWRTKSSSDGKSNSSF